MPRRQVIIVLSGVLEVQASDGEICGYGVGDGILLEDTTGKGPKTRVVGEGEARMVVIQLGE